MITKSDFINVACQYEDTIRAIDRFYAYSQNAFVIDVYEDPAKWSAELIFDAVTDKVLFAGVFDYVNNRAYCLLADGETIHDDYAWDGVEYIILEAESDFLDKFHTIVNGEFDYDPRVEIPLTLPDDELFALMKLAHENDMTLNQLIEYALVEELNRLRSINFSTTNV